MNNKYHHEENQSAWITLIMFMYLMTPELKFFRPLSSHGFSVCDMVSLPLSRSHDRFFITYGFTKFEWILSQKTHTFMKKQTQASHSNAAEELYD